MCHDCGNRLYPPKHLPEHAEHDILKHPTQKPMGLTRRMLLSCINGTGGKVLAPFAGSVSKCVVAQSLGIDFVGCEVNREDVRFAKKWLASCTN